MAWRKVLFFAVFGTGLGPSTPLQVSQYPLPGARDSGETSSRVTIGSVSKDAWMLYTGPSQLLAILPSDTPTGDGTFTVTYLKQTGAAALLRVVAASLASSLAARTDAAGLSCRTCSRMAACCSTT